MIQRSSSPKKRPSKADLSTVADLPVGTPTPVRELGPEGREMWVRLWSMGNPWISPQVDSDHVTLLCEAVDERVALRRQVLADGDWRDRVALRSLDDQIDRMMGALGLNPTDRAKLNVGEAPKGRLAELRASRASRAQ